MYVYDTFVSVAKTQMADAEGAHKRVGYYRGKRYRELDCQRCQDRAGCFYTMT